MRSLRVIGIPFIAGLAAAPLRAQCPDGSPPPCAQRVAVLDPHRIAILPFRVTATDTLLGQGVAELLAPEFTGDHAPLAVNMATVLRAWRRAGGSPRTPLEPLAAAGVARSIGAGRVIEGTVIGLGTTITLSASVVELPRGAPRRVGPLSGSADSLQSLVGRLASGLLGVAGAPQADVQIRLTDVPAAMRAYLQGLANYRAGDFEAAAPMFERALAIDSLFARAALMRFLTGGWLNAAFAPWDTLAWRLRDRLSPADRIFLTGLLGDRFPAARTPRDHLADLRRAASLLPESPDAQFQLGDWLFHFGRSAGIDDDLASAREAMERAWSMDPQLEEILHLVDLGFITGDTTLIRRWGGEWERGGGQTALKTAYARVGRWLLSDASARARFPYLTPEEADLQRNAGWFWLLTGTMMAGVPGNDVARIFGMPDTTTLPALPRNGREAVMKTLVNSGRLSALPVQRADTGVAWLIQSVLDAGGDSAVAALAGRVGPGNFPNANPGAVRLRQQSRDVLAALRSRGPELRAKTAELDSLLRWTVGGGDPHDVHGFESLLLAVAWEASGEPARALAAIHVDEIWDFVFPFVQAPKLRREGRLATIVGDTARAIRAYRRYLTMRRDADPVLIPERDSVQAALGRLQRRP